MRLTFFGTSDFAVPTLQRIHSKGYDVAAVVTQPARPGGRGRKLVPGPVEVAALELQLPVLTPENPNTPDFVARLAELQPDLCVLASYGYILKRPLLEVPKRGFINLHPSLLPGYRGAAPIQRALMAGCTQTGVTTIRMNVRVDAGEILNQEPVPIGPDETAGELTSKLASIGADLVVKTIHQIAEGTSQSRSQDPSSVTRAPKLTDSERFIDWQRPAQELHNLIRGLAPKPAAVTFFRNHRILVLGSRLLGATTETTPGTILPDQPGLAIATGQGILVLLELKPEGKKAQSGQSFCNGYRLEQGDRFENQ